MSSIIIPEEGIASRGKTTLTTTLTGKRKFQAIQPSKPFTANKTYRIDESDKENILPNVQKAGIAGNPVKKVTLTKPIATKPTLSLSLKKTIPVEDKENQPPKGRDILKPAAVKPLRDVKNDKDSVSSRLLSKLPVLGTKPKPTEAGKQAKLTVFEDDAPPQKKAVVKRNPLAPVPTTKNVAVVKKPEAIMAKDPSRDKILPVSVVQKEKEVAKPICKEDKKVEPLFEEEEDDRDWGDVLDIDADGEDDPQQCGVYVDNIFAYLRKLERTYRPRADYLSRQKEVNKNMREVLVDWLIEVATKFRLLPESLFLGVALMDLFFSKKQVGRAKMQLVGIGALLIASKFEEISCPVIDDFVWISADAYKREEIIRVEKIILETIGFNLSVQTPIHFLRRFSKAAMSNTKTHTLCKYLIEVSLMNYEMLKYVPSMIAASAVYIARKMNGIEPVWTPTLGFYTKYTEEELADCVGEMNDFLIVTHDKHSRAVVLKYSKESLLNVAAIPPVELRPRSEKTRRKDEDNVIVIEDDEEEEREEDESNDEGGEC